MKVRFSNAFLVSYKIMQKYMLLLLTIVMWCSSTFVLSYAINFRVYLSQFEVKWTDLTSESYNFHIMYQPKVDVDKLNAVKVVVS